MLASAVNSTPARVIPVEATSGEIMSPPHWPVHKAVRHFLN